MSKELSQRPRLLESKRMAWISERSSRGPGAWASAASLRAVQSPLSDSTMLPSCMRACPIVFTGDMTLSRTEVEARATAAGLRVTASVSAKTALVVAADPYTQSGKANRARQLGVRMVTEQVFLHMLDRTQNVRSAISETPASSL